MKTSDFETNFTAWLDGRLEASQAAAFEHAMRARGFDPVAERAAHASVRTLLREHSPSPTLANADFFQHQIGRQIEHARRKAARPWWTFPRLAWAGAVSLLIAGVLFKMLIPVGGSRALENQDYFATVVDARTYEPAISVDTVYNPKDNVTVLWLDGLDYLPTDIVTQ
jgi:anti-sigma factor RsiW